jgi:hypothetical protein
MGLDGQDCAMAQGAIKARQLKMRKGRRNFFNMLCDLLIDEKTIP